MTDIIEDLFKIYNSAIDSYNAKILQTINDKYTIIDKSMVASYLYIKILDKLKIEEESASDTLISYLLKQMIYGETGNLSLEIVDKKQQKSYQAVATKLIKEKFEYKNRLLVHLKYHYCPLEENRYSDLLTFCEELAEYFILEKISNRGNLEAKKLMNERKAKLKQKRKDAKDKIEQEKNRILDSILENKGKVKEYQNLIDVVLNLRDVYRYSSLTTIIPENVLFHQYLVTITSIILSEYLNEVLDEGIEINKIVYKSLFHDFGEYKGNEIVTQIKNYNEDTIKIFAEIEEKDELELKDKIGNNLYTIMKDYKEEKEGYISEVIDKITGIMKLWIEIEYFNNLTYIKSICSIYQERFKRFKKKEKLKNIKNKEFLLDLLRESYIYIKENMILKNDTILLTYFTKEEKKELLKEIKELKENKDSFLE